jgi:hypothetical protein
MLLSTFTTQRLGRARLLQRSLGDIATDAADESSRSLGEVAESVRITAHSAVMLRSRHLTGPLMQM